ncbi:MAG: aldehyde dehydrogenase family protein [Actinomycetota bacterium]
MTDLSSIPAGTPVVVGDRTIPMPELGPGDKVVAVQATGDLLVVSGADHAKARDAVARADEAFRAMSDVDAEQISQFFRTFADRLADPAIWASVEDANQTDLERARAADRAVSRLVATEKMREAMIDGLIGWAKAPSRRGEVIERRDGPNWTVERRRAPLGVVAFVFEGRPNVFADGVGVLRGGNASVMRIGSDALRTAEAIEASAVAPSLHTAGLPDGAVILVRSPSHGAAHALFTMPEVRLAVARGSGATTSLLGAIAAQHGIPASLHGTGGAWLYLADDAPRETVRNAIVSSLDRKVCNSLNTIVVDRRRSPELVPLVLEALGSRDPSYRLHVAAGSEHDIPEVVWSKRVNVHRTDGDKAEPQVDAVPVEDLAREWEWDTTPEVSLVCARGDDEAIELINTYSPRFVASIVTADEERFERFYERVDTPYVGDAFTRWVDGQWAWDRPELGLSNWERGRILGRSGILSGDDVFTVRDVFRDRSGGAEQTR